MSLLHIIATLCNHRNWEVAKKISQKTISNNLEARLRCHTGRTAASLTCFKSMKRRDSCPQVLIDLHGLVLSQDSCFTAAKCLCWGRDWTPHTLWPLVSNQDQPDRCCLPPPTAPSGGDFMRECSLLSLQSFLSSPLVTLPPTASHLSFRPAPPGSIHPHQHSHILYILRILSIIHVCFITNVLKHYFKAKIK